MKSTLGLRYLAAVVRAGLDEYLSAGRIDHLFTEAEMPAAEFVRQHVAEHGVMPKPPTVEKHSQVDLPEPEEPAGYYLTHLRQRALDQGIRDAVDEVAPLLKGDDRDPRAAVQTMFDRCVGMLAADQSTTMLDFRDSLDSVLAEHTARQMGYESGLRLGWPTLDGMLGGARRGDFISYVGRPQKGKTWFMLWSALDAWERQGKVPMFCTFEMEGHRIRQRLAALYARVPAMALRLGQLTSKAQGRLKERLSTASSVDRPFWVVDAGMASTVPQLAAIAQAVKPDAIYLDGAYLIQHDDRRLDRFRRMDAVAEQIKHVLCPLAPTVSSWQFNRRVSQRKKDDPASGDDVYGSDVIHQVSALQLGIFQPDTPETIHRKLVEVQKGREGEAGQFWTRWDFVGMDFSEAPPPGQQGVDAPELEYT